MEYLQETLPGDQATKKRMQNPNQDDHRQGKSLHAHGVQTCKIEGQAHSCVWEGTTAFVLILEKGLDLYTTFFFFNFFTQINDSGQEAKLRMEIW